MTYDEKLAARVRKALAHAPLSAPSSPWIDRARSFVETLPAK
jgi:hypothetical protein